MRNRPPQRRPLAHAAPLAGLLLVACTQPAPQPPAALRVTTTSFVADWLVERIAGDAVAHQNIHPAGEDPPFWTPTGDVVASAAAADLIVANGAGFEAWMGTAALPPSRVVASADGLDLIRIEGASHRHGGGAEHTHAGIDPHTWSDPSLYGQQGERVAASLIARRPELRPRVEAGLQALRADLAGLDAAWRDTLGPAAGLRFAANHPAFNYLARRYGLSVTNFDFDPASPPSPEALGRFGEWSAQSPVAALLWEEAPSAEARAAFPPDLAHLVLDPLEGPSDGGRYDYVAQTRANQAAFAAFLAGRVGG